LEGVLILGRPFGKTPGFDATLAALLNRHRPASHVGAAPASHATRMIPLQESLVEREVKLDRSK
jgi:hypothetical protein